MTLVPIFDGHNDLLARLALAGGINAVDSYFSGRADGHLDAAKVEAGGFVGGFFAVWVPSPRRGRPSAMNNAMMRKMRTPPYDLVDDSKLQREKAWEMARQQVSILKALEARDALRICTSTHEIETSVKAGQVAAILHMEGAEAIGHDLKGLYSLYDMGLRSLGPVWSRTNIFGTGVPFRFPSTPDIGPGLSDYGRELIRACNTLKVMIDLSHLNEAGFWEVAAMSDAPLVATHSNAHSLCPHARNLTDTQLDAIAESQGVVGVNFATSFLRDDGAMVAETDLDLIIDHVSALIERVGEDGVGFGSDFDGALIPKPLGDASGLQTLVQRMGERGYGPDLIEKVAFKNWLRVLAITWG